MLSGCTAVENLRGGEVTLTQMLGTFLEGDEKGTSEEDWSVPECIGHGLIFTATLVQTRTQ